MKERGLTLLFALGALALFVAMFMRGDPGLGRKREVSRPTTIERGENGYSAALAWLRHEGVQARSLRQSWEALEHDATLPRAGNLLILTLPGKAPLGSVEYASLRRWLGAGNTLLIVAAMTDNPDWAHSVGGLGRGDLGVLTGLDFDTVRSRDSRRQPAMSGRLASPRQSEAVPNRSHPYFAGVAQMIALSDFPPQARDVGIPFDGFVLELAHQRQTGEGTLWARKVRGGDVLISAYGSLWTNRALGLAGNARLLANIVATTTVPGGFVVFDDAHQGVSPAYDPASFYRDPRLYATGAVILALWLIWVVGGTRLAGPPARARGLPDSGLIDAGGSLFARVVPAHAAASRLIQLFAARLRSRGELAEFLAGNPRVGRDELMQLKRWSNDAAARKKVPLIKLYNLLLRLESRLS